jgi:VanZ family protein
VIFALSSVPGQQLPTVSLPQSDKLAHAMVYGVLGALGFRATRLSWSSPRSPLVTAAVAVAIATVYGISDELHQNLTPQRTPDWHDVAADMMGGALGALVMMSVPWMKSLASSMMGRSDA